mmetsp:Transcript_70354/g.138330  ORF Transcript_70354/g.138330 Transcript_70354/m.138330 type:complete len:350 (+) Transcript_70354:85-1134(+)
MHWNCAMLGWVSSGQSNHQLVENLRYVTQLSNRVASALHRVDRFYYVRERPTAYSDSPQPIGYGATISAPHMHALALKTLEPYIFREVDEKISQESDKSPIAILDVGSGSGYLTSCFAEILRGGAVVIGSEPTTTTRPDDVARVGEDRDHGSHPGSHGSSISHPGECFEEGHHPALVLAGGGHVVGVEHIPQLVAWSLENVAKDGKGMYLEQPLMVKTAPSSIPVSSPQSEAASKVAGDEEKKIDVGKEDVAAVDAGEGRPVTTGRDPQRSAAAAAAAAWAWPLLSLFEGDGYNGWEEAGPFDAIHVGAAVEEVPQALLEQLKPGGAMVVPIGPPGHQVNLVTEQVTRS